MKVTIAGERWFADKATFKQDMPQIWGDWGVSSEIGKLKSVLMRRPGPEIDGLTDPDAIRFMALPDPERARDEHDALAEMYRQNGVAVHYVDEMPIDKPNGYFCRDLAVMTPEGAVICRPGLRVRRGEERYVAGALSRLGVPIIKTVNGTGTFEGADLMWLDRETAFLGIGNRSNAEGIRQVEQELRTQGVKEVFHVQVPYGSAHLDGLFNIVDKDLVLVFPWQTPFVVADVFRSRGYRILEATWLDEVKLRFALNFVALSPGRIVAAKGNVETPRILREAGVEVLEVDVTELMKGWGSVHCMTTFLKREEV